MVISVRRLVCVQGTAPNAELSNSTATFTRYVTSGKMTGQVGSIELARR